MSISSEEGEFGGVASLVWSVDLVGVIDVDGSDVKKDIDSECMLVDDIICPDVGGGRVEPIFSYNNL